MFSVPWALAAGLELTAGELLLGLVTKVPGVPGAPGVPGVRTLEAAAGATPFAPPGEPSWAQAVNETKTANGITAIGLIRLDMVLS